MTSVTTVTMSRSVTPAIPGVTVTSVTTPFRGVTSVTPRRPKSYQRRKWISPRSSIDRKGFVAEPLVHCPRGLCAPPASPSPLPSRATAIKRFEINTRAHVREGHNTQKRACPHRATTGRMTAVETGQIVAERGHCTRSGTGAPNRQYGRRRSPQVTEGRARYVRRTMSRSGIPQRYIAVRRYSCLTRVDFTIMRRYEGRV